MKRLLALVPIALSLLAASGANAADPPASDPVDPGIADGTAVREFRQARERWLRSGIADYRMTVSRSCFCISPSRVRVTVRGGKPVSISERPWYGPRTVPGMLRIVSQAIKRRAAVLDVTYDSRLGIPKRTSIDYIAMAVDDEISYRISKFRKLVP